MTERVTDEMADMVPANFHGLLAILDRWYPAEVFTASAEDVGVRLVALARRVAELEAEVESWQTRWTVDGARVAELEKAVRRHQDASQSYARFLGGGWTRTAAGRRREIDAWRELRVACDELDALLPDIEDRGQ